MANFFKEKKDGEGIILNLKVKPSSKNNLIDGVITFENQEYLKISIKEKPENYKANEALVKFLSKILKIKKSEISIIYGEKSNFKKIFLKNITPSYLNLILSDYINSDS